MAKDRRLGDALEDLARFRDAVRYAREKGYRVDLQVDDFIDVRGPKPMVLLPLVDILITPPGQEKDE